MADRAVSAKNSVNSCISSKHCSALVSMGRTFYRSVLAKMRVPEVHCTVAIWRGFGQRSVNPEPQVELDERLQNLVNIDFVTCASVCWAGPTSRSVGRSRGQSTDLERLFLPHQVAVYCSSFRPDCAKLQGNLAWLSHLHWNQCKRKTMQLSSASCALTAGGMYMGRDGKNEPVHLTWLTLYSARLHIT